MHEILVVGDLPSLPLKSDIFELIDPKATNWHSFWEYAINFIPNDLVFKGKIVGTLFCVDLKSDFP